MDGGMDRTRLADSVETAIRLGGGVMKVADVTDAEFPRDHLFSEHFACVHCGVSLPEIEPRTFSFHSPPGAGPACSGLGTEWHTGAHNKNGPEPQAIKSSRKENWSGSEDK